MNTERFKKGDLLKKAVNEDEYSVLRVVSISENDVMVIDCIKKSMPKWCGIKKLEGYEVEQECEADIKLSPSALKKAYDRYNMISSILPYIGNVQVRSQLIHMTAEQHDVSEQTVRKYICDYLAANHVSALAPQEREQKALTVDEKNMRKSLNKWYYTTKKRSLKNCYTLMLEKYYCDETGQLLPEHPSMYQFRYFFRKYNQKSKEYISRNGLSFYQRNQRPLTGGGGVQEFAGTIGMGMLDSTICDIYLVNESAEVIGRPVLTLCVDAYSGIVCGYSLSWEGAVYSLRNLMVNVISDKVEHCRKFGIDITEQQWPCLGLPLKMLSDQGSEYKGCNFEQISDLGIELINLKSYRAELKGSVEKAFDTIQGYMEPYLKGYGYVEPDFQERGAHDYRKDACLTLSQYEAILLNCIIFYNSNRVIEDFRMTEEMIADDLRPIPCEIWKWAEENYGANFINVDKDRLILALLPRTIARFTRKGLSVNGLLYHNKLYQEAYLEGRSCEVAYDPDSSNRVWMIENGSYIQFDLTQSRFKNKSLEAVEGMKAKQRQLVKAEQENKTQAEIDLARSIRLITDGAKKNENVSIKNIRENRKKEEIKVHKNHVREAGL